MEYGDLKIGGITPPAGDFKFVQANGDVVDILHVFDGPVHIWPPQVPTFILVNDACCSDYIAPPQFTLYNDPCCSDYVAPGAPDFTLINDPCCSDFVNPTPIITSTNEECCAIPIGDFTLTNTPCCSDYVEGPVPAITSTNETCCTVPIIEDTPAINSTNELCCSVSGPSFTLTNSPCCSDFTVPVEPNIVTHAVTNIAQTSATGSGTASGGNVTVTSRGIAWSTSSFTTNPTDWVYVGSGLGFYSSNMTPLLAGTTYYVRAFIITTEFSVKYGNEVLFTTPNPTPTITSISEDCCSVFIPIPTFTLSNDNCCSDHVVPPTPAITSTNESCCAVLIPIPTFSLSNDSCCSDYVPAPPTFTLTNTPCCSDYVAPTIPAITSTTTGCCSIPAPTFSLGNDSCCSDYVPPPTPVITSTNNSCCSIGIPTFTLGNDDCCSDYVAPALTSYLMSSPGTTLLNVCEELTTTQFWHDGAGTFPVLNDKVYTTSGGAVFNGGSLYYKIGASDNIRIGSDGIVILEGVC